MDGLRGPTRFKLVVLLGAFALVLSGACHARGALSMSEFRDRFMAQLETADPGLKLQRVGQNQVDIVDAGGSKSSTFLDNAYQRYVADPSELDHVLAVDVRVALEARTRRTVAADELIALVRPAAFFAPHGAGTMARKTTAPPLTRPFSGDLLQVVGLDGPDSIAYSGCDDVRRAAPGGDDAIWTTALRNVEELRGAVRASPLRNGLVEVSTNPGMASSVLIDGSLFGLPDVKVMGSKIAVLIGKDSVIVGRSDDPQAIQAMLAIAGDDTAEWVSTGLYAPTPGGWMALAEP